MGNQSAEKCRNFLSVTDELQDFWVDNWTIYLASKLKCNSFCQLSCNNFIAMRRELNSQLYVINIFS